jgi:uncharacterized protein (TIGR02147 family)
MVVKIHKKPDIYDYLDHLEYLSHFFNWKNTQNPKFSKSEFSRLLGMPNTRSYFNDVLKGKKISDSFVERFLQILELSDRESVYFRTLVGFNQSDVEQERETAYEFLIKLRRRHILPEAVDQMEYYKDWHNGAIRTLLDVIPCKGDPADIRRFLFPSIPLTKIKESLDLLLRLGMIAPDTHGYLKPIQKHLSSGSYSSKQQVLLYQSQQIDLLKKNILKRGSVPSNTSTSFVSVSNKAYGLIEQKLQEFKNEIRSIINTDSQKPDCAYMIINSLTPLMEDQK